MPAYDYICSTCRHRVEVIHRIHDQGPQVCPHCGADGTMRKGIVTTAVHFKGAGWAKKDRAATPRPVRARGHDGDGSPSKAPADAAPAATPAGDVSTSTTSATSATGGD